MDKQKRGTYQNRLIVGERACARCPERFHPSDPRQRKCPQCQGKNYPFGEKEKQARAMWRPFGEEGYGS